MFRRKAIFGLVTLLLLTLLLSAAEKAPASFKSSGVFAGGIATENVALSGVRFGNHTDYTRMVLDFADHDSHSMAAVAAHPVYSIEYMEYPYRLVVTLQDVWFDPDAKVSSKPALPFSVVAHEDSTIKEMQVYLPGPCEFKVIEVDDPVKLSIDIREVACDVPSIYTVQVTGPATATEAFALVEQGEFPAAYTPITLVLGEVVVVEQVFTNPANAASMDASLREMGYASVINERRGDELPVR